MDEQLKELVLSLPKDVAVTTVDTLLKITQNIISNPNEDQFKKLRLSNSKFNERVWQYPSARGFLFLSGWIEAGDFIVFIEDTGSVELQKALDTLSQIKHQLVDSTANPTTVASNVDSTRDRIKQLREESRRQQEERKRINDQIKADREVANQRKAISSQSKPTNFGGNVKRFEDIGVDLNSQWMRIKIYKLNRSDLCKIINDILPHNTILVRGKVDDIQSVFITYVTSKYNNKI